MTQIILSNLESVYFCLLIQSGFTAMRPISVYKKYAYYFRKFGTVKKFNNIRINRNETKNKAIHLKSFPYNITIDPGNVCNLACPCCQTGFKHPEMITPKMMRFDQFKLVFDYLKEYALSVALYNWGEPFLNKKIFEMFAYAYDNRVGTTIHSNLNIFNEEMAEKAIKSGLTHVYLSIDGASQETYVQYRVKGDFDRVMNNLNLLVQKKKNLGSKYPLVTWKYLIFPHNEHEVDKALNMAKEIGVDSTEVYHGSPIPFDIVDQAKYYQDNPELLDKEVDDQCVSLWNRVYINADGSVFPCSLAFRQNEVFGNLNESTFEEIWNNEKYTNARKMFSEPMEKGTIPKPCSTCKYCLKFQPDQFIEVDGKTTSKGVS